MSTNNPGHAGLRQAFNIAAWVEFGLAFLLLCARFFASWRIVKHIASDFYLALATFVRAIPHIREEILILTLWLTFGT